MKDRQQRVRYKSKKVSDRKRLTVFRSTIIFMLSL